MIKYHEVKCLSKLLKLWLKLIYMSFSVFQKYCTIVFKEILFFIQYMRNPDSYFKKQLYSQILYSSSNLCHTLTHPSGSNANIFESYPDLYVWIQYKYYLGHIMTHPWGSNADIVLHIDLIFSLNNIHSSGDWNLLTCPNLMVKIILSEIWWGSP